MIIGAKLQFAVEYELDKKYGGVWLFGRFCYWINGQRIGDYELGTSLRDILFNIVPILRDNGNRTNNDLFNLESAKLYGTLNEALYGHEISQYDNISIEETWARFDIRLPVDVFDKWKIFLIENKERSRVVFKSMEGSDVREAFLIPGEFDNVMNCVYGELNRIYEVEVETKHK